MKEEIFCCQKSYGNTTRMNLKKKSVSVSGIFGRTNQKCFQYDQRPSFIRAVAAAEQLLQIGYILGSKAKTYPQD